MFNLEFFHSMNGVAQMWAADGQFLGILSSDPADPYSIINPDGIFGSLRGIYSIRNTNRPYGNTSGIYSPYNFECIHPPFIFYQQEPVLAVTKNHRLRHQLNNLPIIDPDLVLELYLKFANSALMLNQYQRYYPCVQTLLPA